MNRTFTLCFSLYPIALPFGYVLIYTFYHYAVPDANSNLTNNLEYGFVDVGTVASKDNISGSVSFANTHTESPKTILLSYSTYGYFYGRLHVESGSQSKRGFTYKYMPAEIGNGKGTLVIYWAAFW